MAKELQVTVPDIGDYQGVPVIDVLVKVGDTVEKDAALVTLESDKATLDVPAPEAGVVKSIKLKAGDKVSKGDAVLSLEVGGNGGGDGDEAAKPAEAAKPKKDEGQPAAAPAKKTGRDKAAEAPKEEKAEPKAGKTAAAGNQKLEVTVPDIGDYQDVPVIEVLVKDGDTVEKDATLLTLESDKATLDVPAPAAGVVSAFKIKVGDKVSKGMPVCTIEGGDAAAADGEEKSASPKSARNGDTGGDVPAPALSQEKAEAHASETRLKDGETAAEPAAMPADGDPKNPVPYASPSIRKFARELGVDLNKVNGSGPKDRILIDDVQGFIKKKLATPAASSAAGGGIPPIPAVDFAAFGAIETKPLARIRKLSSAHLQRAWLNIPHVTQTDEADITELEAFRKTQNEEVGRDGAKLTLLPFILKAVVKAIDAYPEFASSLSPDGESLVMKRYRHLGFAADTPNGLVVPVVRDVDRKGVQQLATETAELAKRARDGKLKGEEMRGGVFSVSSLGGIGGSHFTPIVNAPEVAILGVSRSLIKPVWDGQAFQPRLMVPLSLSYDHRVIDGAYAARFIVLLAKLLADLRRLAL